jgi:hypothetical protein
LSEDQEPAPTKSFSALTSIAGFDESEGTELANIICDAIRAASEVIDLSALEGVTVTPTYRETLATFDRGMPDDPPTPTLEDYAFGCAMVVRCKRGEEFKCHVFLDTNFARSLLLEDSNPAKTMARSVLFHELAHVYDFGRIARSLADAKFQNHLARWLFLLTNATWSEYFACFATAQGDPSLDDYVTTFINALNHCPRAVREEIIAYRRYNDLEKLMEFVKDRIGLLFKFAGYVLGNLAALGRPLSETHPDAWRSIQEAGFADTWLRLETALKEMLDYPAWDDVSVYDGLGQCAVHYLGIRGLYLHDKGDDFYVNVPFTAETMPPGWRS